MRFLTPLKIVRFHIVAGGFLAFSIGALLAIVSGGSFEITRFVLGYFVVLFGDLSTHYSNDYFDVEVDKHIEQKKIFSGSNILVSNPDLRLLSRSISVVLLISSNVLAIMLVLFLGMPIEFPAVILGASLVGWFYSAPPIRLTSRGLGELAVACVTGFAIPSLGYLALRGQFDPFFAYFVPPFVMYGLALSLSLEAPDVEIDRKGKKMNLAARRGERFVFFLAMTTALSATTAFCVYSWQFPSSIVDFRVLSLFSIVPSAAGLVAFFGNFRKKNVNNLSALNVFALFFFNASMMLYLVSIVL